MAIYKGFQLYWCDASTYENLEPIGRIEYTFINMTGDIPNGSNVSSSISNIDSYTDERNQIITPFIVLSMSANTNTQNQYQIVQEILSGAVYIISPDPPRNTVRLKLVANNGYYAVSTESNAPFGGTTYESWYIFDANGNQFDTQQFTAIIIRFNYQGVTFSGRVNNTGDFASGDRIYRYLVGANTNGNNAAISRQSYITLNAKQAEWLNAVKSEITPIDPFSPGGESEPGGGTGDFDGTSDPIDFPDLPDITSLDTGFIQIFVPTEVQLQALANFMWSDNLFDISTWQKLFANPMDAILGLSIVPVAVPAVGPYSVRVGNILTTVSMKGAVDQYVEVDCGTLNVNEYWGAYLDYEPFTKAEIYLPYIGTHAIAVDDIMGKPVHIKYHVDIISGACAAYIKCGDSVLYSFIGQCSSSIPISGNDWTNVINGVISAATSIGSMVATGGATAPFAVPALASTAVNSMKPNIEKSGGMSGTGGLLGIQTPYLILTRPRQCLPAAQNEYMGYPSFTSSVLGDLTGYTEVEQIHLDGIAATDAEISEIETLLKSGVIL